MRMQKPRWWTSSLGHCLNVELLLTYWLDTLQSDIDIITFIYLGGQTVEVYVPKGKVEEEIDNFLAFVNGEEGD